MPKVEKGKNKWPNIYFQFLINQFVGGLQPSGTDDNKRHGHHPIPPPHPTQKTKRKSNLLRTFEKRLCYLHNDIFTGRVNFMRVVKMSSNCQKFLSFLEKNLQGFFCSWMFGFSSAKILGSILSMKNEILCEKKQKNGKVI